MKFYVYELIDPRDGVVFYIGKGQGGAIAALRGTLTNIIGGITTNAEAAALRAKELIRRTKSLEEWERTITPRQRAAVVATMGSLRAFHDDRMQFLQRIADTA